MPRQLGIEISGDLLPSVDVGYDYRAPLVAYWLSVGNGAGSYTANSYGGTVNPAGTAVAGFTSSPVLVNAGSGANLNDNNREKSYTARVEFIPPHDYNSWFRQVKIGVSAAFDWSNGVAATPTAALATDPQAVRDEIAAAARANPAGKLLDYDEHRRLGFDISYTHSPISFTYEFVASADTTTTNRVYDRSLSVAANQALGYGPVEATVYGRGQAFTFGWIFGEQFLSNNVRDGGKWDDAWPKSYQPYVRYDTWNPNKDQEHEVRNLSLGANIFFAQTTKFQVQASQIRSEIVDETWHELLVQFQYGF